MDPDGSPGSSFDCQLSTVCRFCSNFYKTASCSFTCPLYIFSYVYAFLSILSVFHELCMHCILSCSPQIHICNHSLNTQPLKVYFILWNEIHNYYSYSCYSLFKFFNELEFVPIIQILQLLLTYFYLCTNLAL